MTIDDTKIVFLDITKQVKENNPFVRKELKAYEFMNSDWYGNNVYYSFWKRIQKCVSKKLPNYSLWYFNQVVLEDTKINRFKGVAKNYIRKGKQTGEYRGYVIMKENELKIVSPHKYQTKGETNKTILRFYIALEYKNIGVFDIDIESGESPGYYLLLPKNIKEETIITFLKNWKSINSTCDKELLQINIDIYNFLIGNKGILIEGYNDSSYYEYKGEAEGFVIVDPFNLCPIRQYI